MKAYYKLFLFLALGSFVAVTGCQDDETLDLVKFPVNQPTITIDNMEGASTAALKAIYKQDGTLQLDGPVSRTYTFHFAASPEDATITFDILNTNIPKENIEISATKVVLPAGFTDASVTVTLKDEDFSFAESNYDEGVYELGVKATAEGYKVVTDPVESKVVIKKEAYVAACSIDSKAGYNILFERAYSNGVIVNPDPISYTFKMKLDKPARKDVKIKLATTGLNDKFMNNITVTPAEIVIPAGKVTSADITWTITDDFLLTTTDPEKYVLKVAASIECEDPVVVTDQKANLLTFNIEKVFRNFQYMPEKVATWVELSKTDWAVTKDPTASGSGSAIINGVGGTSGSDLFKGNDFWFIVDMKSEKTISGFGIDYYHNSSPSSPKKVTISTSSDNVNWVVQGTIDTPQSYNHYFQFFAPLSARYMKVELAKCYNYYIDVTEIYVYSAN